MTYHPYKLVFVSFPASPGAWALVPLADTVYMPLKRITDATQWRPY
jgi:hypothetical protein